MSTNGVEKPNRSSGKKKEPKTPKSAPRVKVNPKLAILQDVIALMGEAQINEVHFEQAGVKIHLRKGFGPSMETGMVPTLMPAASLTVSSPQSGNAPAAQGSPAVVVESNDKTIKVNAPMVGTLYHAPAPDAKPFITEGGRVEVGQVFCIIEAMKLMNEIKSEVSGKIVKILVANGQAVEFGQPILVVDPS